MHLQKHRHRKHFIYSLSFSSAVTGWAHIENELKEEALLLGELYVK